MKLIHSAYPPVSILNHNPASTDVSFILEPGKERTYFESRVDHDGEPQPAMRIFKSSPESMTVQIRTCGPVTDRHGGKNRAVFSSFSYNRQGMLRIAAEIERIAKLLPEA